MSLGDVTKSGTSPVYTGQSEAAPAAHTATPSPLTTSVSSQAKILGAHPSQSPTTSVAPEGKEALRKAHTEQPTQEFDVKLTGKKQEHETRVKELKNLSEPNGLKEIDAQREAVKKSLDSTKKDISSLQFSKALTYLTNSKTKRAEIEEHIGELQTHKAGCKEKLASLEIKEYDAMIQEFKTAKNSLSTAKSQGIQNSDHRDRMYRIRVLTDTQKNFQTIKEKAPRLNEFFTKKGLSSKKISNPKTELERKKNELIKEEKSFNEEYDRLFGDEFRNEIVE